MDEATRAVVHEALRVLTPVQDVEAIKGIKADLGQLEARRHAQQTEARALVQEWLARTAEAETRVRAAADGRQAVDSLADKRAASVQQVSSIERDCETLESTVRSLHDQLSALQARARAIDEEAQVEDPLLRTTLTLFAQMTSIIWDYDSALVKGYVSLSNDIRPFQLDPKRLGPLYIANHLWDLV